MPSGSSSTTKQPSLYVEGPDDLHTIAGLVARYGYDYKKDRRAPEIKFSGGIEKLLDESIDVGIKASTNLAVGFVVDADAPIVDRWRAVRDRLLRSGVDHVPDHPPPDGFIGTSSPIRSRVGVWLMPDNQADGDLETFLRSLIREADPIIAHAEEATTKAKGLGAAFGDADRRKATIHAWLAWQAEPGCPYGTAITAHYFAHDPEIALRFVAWYVALYQLGVQVS